MENLVTGFVMKEKECERKSFFLTARIHIQNLKCNLIYRLCIVRTSECFTITNFLFYFLTTSGWKKEFNSCWRKIFEMGNHRQDSDAPPPTYIHFTFPLHYLVLQNPGSSIILYTYTKLRTPVFSVKQCYAYLYCMYSMYIPSFALELCSFIYPKVKCNYDQYFEAKCLLLL